MADITLYKASAGAGKTYQLTSEYLGLMFNPDTSFSQILAVTFTNKATAEMAERIISELYKLALGEVTGHADMLMEKYSLTPEELQKQAKFNLNRLLHNYTRFNISTIDSFFQRILKSFTREVGLNVGFNVELNQGQVVEDAVARLFEHFHENKSLQKWLVNYSRHNLEAGKSWDIQKQMVRFANEALGEVFLSLNQEQLNQLADFSKFEEYKKNLLVIIYDFEKSLNILGSQAAVCMKTNGLAVDDFSYKSSGPAGYLLKLENLRYYDIKDGPGKRLVSAALAEDNTTGWGAKKSTKLDLIESCVSQGLKRISLDVIKLFEDKSNDFFTAQAILAQIDSFAILVEIFKELLNYCDEKNIFLLSMASPLLSKMIGEDDATFIYEKTGESLRHFMIDEFQDTSSVQWKNFFPLFYNGVSQGYSSLVVGDIKQSIYRWRSGDWSLLDSKVKSQFKGYDVQEKNLPFNWRSDGRVVRFNNWLFSKGAECLAQEMGKDVSEEILTKEQRSTFTRIYENASQKVPNVDKENLGYVSVRFFEENVNEDEDTVMEKLLSSIQALNEKGFKGKDIAIIVRRNTEGAKVAKFLMEQMQQYPEHKDMLRFVSNDSVFLESSAAIKLLVSLLQFCNNPKDKLAKAQVLKLYLQLSVDENRAIKLMATVDLDDELSFFESLPSEFLNSYNKLQQLPLVDLVDRLIKIFFGENSEVLGKERVFLDTFQDYVLDLGVKKNHDIAMFLSWWNEGGNRKPISISESQDAMRIMTIHKSKGLEFKVVIVPYLNWEFEQRSKILWCKPEGEPFNALELVPVAYGSLLKNTQFNKAYYHEQQLAWIDNFNLLYVALTRAEKALFVFAPMPPKSGKLNSVGTLLFRLLNQPQLLQELEGVANGWDNENGKFDFGELIPSKDSEEVISEPLIVTFKRKQNGIHGVGIRQHALEYFSQEVKMEKAMEGLFLHKVFEQITYLLDIDRVVKNFVAEGLIKKDQEVYVTTYIHQAIADSKVEAWFVEGVKVYNERSLVLTGKEIRRPDRVMLKDGALVIVDYKFTESVSKAHEKQVKEYMDLLQQIENKPVKGFLWYVNQKQVVEVD